MSIRPFFYIPPQPEIQIRTKNGHYRGALGSANPNRGGGQIYCCTIFNRSGKIVTKINAHISRITLTGRHIYYSGATSSYHAS